MTRKEYFLFVFLLFAIRVLSQSELNVRTKLGFSFSYGNQSFLKTDYRYTAYIYQFQYFRKLIYKPSWGIDFMLSPHYATTRFYHNSEWIIPTSGFEFGLNGGILFRKNILKDYLHAICILSSGPHYVSDVPERQRIGFIFSDNASAGLMFKTGSGFYATTTLGIRHISNANTRLPNHGINNFLWSLGFLFPLN